MRRKRIARLKHQGICQKRTGCTPRFLTHVGSVIAFAKARGERPKRSFGQPIELEHVTIQSRHLGKAKPARSKGPYLP